MSFNERLRAIVGAVPQGDKIAHAIGGGVATGGSIFLGVDPYNATHVATYLGIAKEIYDWHHQDRHTSDVWDIVATGGGGAGVAIINQLGGWKWLISLVS